MSSTLASSAAIHPENIWEEVIPIQKQETVLIVDDDHDWCAKIKECLESDPLFDVMEPVYSGDKAVELIERHRPDAIILDLLLPVFDGMYIIDHIKNNMHDYRPIVYVCSAIGTDKTNRVLTNCDTVIYYNIKPIHTDTVANNLRRFLNAGLHNIEPQNVGLSVPNSPQNLDWMIEDYLNELGAGASMLQKRCARAAIEICIKAGRDSRVSIMKVYEQVAQSFDPPLTRSAVERNIRLAIANARKINTPLFKQHFPGDFSISNSTFVQQLASILGRSIVEKDDDTISG